MSRFFLILICSLLFLGTAAAGIFGKKTKPGPQRVSELVGILLNHPEADKRADAASELADADAAAHPEVLHALIEALHKDSSSSVRRAAASSLGKLQPPSVEAYEALDRAIKHDDSWTVRAQARMARLGYRVPKSATPIPVAVQPTQGHAKPAPLPSTTKPSTSQPVPATTPALPQNNPLLDPQIPPSNLELAPPPRLQSPTGSGNSSEPAKATLLRPDRTAKPTFSDRQSAPTNNSPTRPTVPPPHSGTKVKPSVPSINVPPDPGPILVPPPPPQP
ncbi:MAG: HEAT repeat domain-containing protein [Gemmatales bacterium]|nr:HEAT repeat domain-containing protein [Gemmatales bacterium]MCS7159884.1 HEAT repeat domain-containing protein [Gemmatales bacterium]MDW8175083.1 HEAT repeat domain-containing protein [Gemmatales bacterium]MDW8221764.1 HEAT repeat domain-containing protein [Gemmatales bacterium]